MNKWQEIKLGGLIDINQSSIGRNYEFENIRYYDISSIGTGVAEDPKNLSISEAPSRAKRIIKDGDTILATVRPGNRSFYYFKKARENDIASTGFAVISPKNNLIDNKFLYYLTSAQSFTNYLVSNEQGATYPAITPSVINRVKINLPPLPTQQKIAKILSNYDDLIENNLKRIKLLEESARLTYEEWFLRFRIDGKKLEIDSDTGLPFGWECKLMKDFGEVVTGKTPSTDNESYYGGDIPFVKTPSMHGNTYTLETADYLTNLGANSQQNKFLSKNSLMVSCIGTAGVYSLVAGNCQTNQQINSIRFYKDEYTFYIYGFAGHLTNVLDAIGSNGATMTNVNKTKFENIKAPMPSIDLLERFHNTFNSNFESILNIMKQNQLLKEARDILLPRLMTGMIDTDDMDIAI